MASEVILDINVADIMRKHELYEGGRLQRVLAEEIIRLSDDYVPFDQGVLKNSAYFLDGYVVYDTPYARYQYYGKLMVDPITKKGAFFDPEYGFWSRPNVKKELTDRDLTYHNNETGLRGSHWVERMWADKGEQICKKLERGKW